MGGGGRKGNNGITNLFKGIARCGTCSGKMIYLNKGKNAAYLTCDAAHKGGSCEKRGYPYRDFETSFFSFVTELDLSSVQEGQIQPSRMIQLSEKRQAVQGRLDALELRRERIFELISEPEFVSDYVSKQLASTEEDIRNLSNELHELTQQSSDQSNWKTDFNSLKKLVKELKAKSDDYVVRSHVPDLLVIRCPP